MLKSLKSHISNVVSLERDIANLDEGRIARQLKKRLTAQVNENKRQLKKICRYEAGLDNNLLNGNLTKTEYKSIKTNYTEDADIIIAENEQLQREMNGVLSYKHEQMAWIEHFKEFAGINALNRRVVVNLIQSITVKSKTDIEIVFHYQSEYETALALIGGVN